MWGKKKGKITDSADERRGGRKKKSEKGKRHISLGRGEKRMLQLPYLLDIVPRRED